MVFVVGIGTLLQFAYHVFHALAAFIAARGGIDGHGRQVVASHVSVESVPVGIGLRLRLQSGLFAVGSQQTVTVVFQQGLDVQVACMFQRTVKQGDIAQRELVGIQFVLCPSRCGNHCEKGDSKYPKAIDYSFIHVIIIMYYTF